MPTVAIVYHSGFGHTKKVAEHIQKGAASVPGTQAILVSAEELPDPDADRNLNGRWSELDEADAIVFGCPTYMASVSAGLKRVFEASSAVWLKQGWRDKLAAGFTNSGGLSGDKLNCLQDIAQFAAQHSMVWVSQGLFPDGKGLNRVGSWLGLMTQADNAPPEQTPGEADLDTAEKFGARVAEATARWTKA